MSERPVDGAHAPASSFIRSPKDFWGGVSLILLAVFALWASGDLPGMRGFAFGPGTAPRLFAYCLLALGAGVTATGLFSDGAPLERYTFSGPLGAAILVAVLVPINLAAARFGNVMPRASQDVLVAAVSAIAVVALAFALMRFCPRGPLFITASTLVFAVAVRPLGLVVASYVSLVAAALATEEARWVETLIWAAVLTAFCAVLFPYGLNLPLPLWPQL